MLDPHQLQDLENSVVAGKRYIYSVTQDPTTVPLQAVVGTLGLGVGSDPSVKGKAWVKQDDGLSTNWREIPGALASLIINDSSVPGTTVKDALNNLGTPFTRGGLWYDIEPEDGRVLPVAAPPAARAYYTDVLYSATPAFFDGSSLRQYIAMYGGVGSAQTVAFSDDGETWDTEALVTGLTGLGYHGKLVLIGTTLHLFYWDSTPASLYTSGAIRHATFDITTDCVNPLTDNPLSGTYLHGGAVLDLRRGSYGPAKVFYNSAPTNNPADPYSYTWCMIHLGTEGANEGILFATSTDGLNFSAWNGLTEVVPRGVAPAWDQFIGATAVWIDSRGLYHMFYSGGIGTIAGEDTNYGGGLGYATSIDGITWTKHDRNPILRKTEAFKSWKRCYNPCVVQDASSFWLYYTAKGKDSAYVTSRAKMYGHI